MDKLLSIIVPSYNMEKYLPKCLGSLVVDDADMLNRLDVIAVNDGSKDRTSEIAHGFEAKYPGVFRVIDKANGNYGSCINAALPTARGRFVKILDADDTYDTVAFGRYLKELAKLPETTDMVVNDWVQVDETGHISGSTTYPFPVDARFGIEKISSRDSFVGMYAVAYRTALLLKIGYKQTEGISYTDTEWTYSPVAVSRDVHYVRQPVYRYLVGRPGQTVERAIFVRNVWMQDKIIERMLKQYDTISCSSMARDYLKWRLQKMFSLSLTLHFRAGFGVLFVDYLEDVRRKVLAYSFLSEAVRSLSVFTSTPFRFRYADFVLRHPFWTRSVLLFVNGYASILECLIRGGRRLFLISTNYR